MGLVHARQTDSTDRHQECAVRCRCARVSPPSPSPSPASAAGPPPRGASHQGLLISPHHHQFTTRHRPRRSILPCDPPGHDGRFNHHSNQIILLILHATTTTRVLDQVAASRQVARTDPAQLLSISLHVCVFLPLGLSIDLERNSEHNKQRGRMRTGHLNQGHAGRPAIKNSTPHQPAPPTLHQL